MTSLVMTSTILLETSDQLEFFAVSEISDNGQIVGYGGHFYGQDKIGISWQAGTVPATILNPLAGSGYAEAFGVSDSFIVVGLSQAKYDPLDTRATEWVNGTAQSLAGYGYDSGAWAVNDQGQVAGYATIDASGDTEAVLWTNGQPTLLGHIGGDTHSGAAAINDAGQVVGTSENAAGAHHAFLWQNGAMTALGTLAGGTSSSAMDINKAGQIVGFGKDSGGIQRAILWVNGAASALPGLTATGAAEAEWINDSGLIAGYATTAAGAKHAVLWQNGQIIDLNSLLPSGTREVLTEAFSINDSGQIVAQETVDIYTINQVTFSIAAPSAAVTARSAIQAYENNPKVGAVAISDSAANIQSSLDGLQNLAAASKLLSITLIDSAEPTITLTEKQWDADGQALDAITGKYKLIVTDSPALDATFLPPNASVKIVDSAANVSASLDNLWWMAGGSLASITLTDSAAIAIPYYQLTRDLPVLPLISGTYSIAVTDATLSQATSLPGTSHLTGIGVSDTIANVLAGGSTLSSLQAAYVLSVTLDDSSANLVAHLDAITPLIAKDAITAITLTDAGAPTLSITAAQLANDAAALKLIQGNFDLSIDASAANLTIHGVPGGHGNTVVFQGTASEYRLAGLGNGQGLTVTDIGTGRSSVDTLTGINALQFSDHTVIVAAAPGTSVTSGNITELYAAVFGREPDTAGLSFYENYLAANPKTPLLTFAQWFLKSPEYIKNWPGYSSDSVGDAAFVGDLYQHLLGRAPAAGDAAWYETNVVAPLIKGLPAGTTDYDNALSVARATIVTYFSQSTEFLNDVQITAQNPASAQHWLMLT